jgi:chromosome partitioning protein
MNTKGGVGKSTVVLAIAETLSAFHGKNVLVIDSDSQASVSSMLMTPGSLHKLQSEGLTIVDFLIGSVLQNEAVDWPKFVVRSVSDVDDARSVFVIPSDMQLTLFEREVSKESLHGRLRAAIAGLMNSVRGVFDVILIDCPPGLSVLTESWLREADFHISPTKADYVSTCGLEVFRRFKALNPEMGFAENMGVLINMKDRVSPSDNEYHRWLASNADNKCFETAVPRMGALQDAARYQTMDRSYQAKYPGEAGVAVRALANEVLARLAAANAAPAPVAAPVPVSVPAAAPAAPVVVAAPAAPATQVVAAVPVVITPTPITPPAPISTSSIDEALQQVQNAVRR